MLFWLNLGKGILKRPWIIVIMVMTLAMGGMWIKINSLEGDIVKLQAQVVSTEKNYNTCKSNELSYLEGIDEQHESIENLNTTIAGLQQQVKDQYETGLYWERKYKNRPVITRIEQVPVIEYIEKGVVVDEKTSQDYIDYFNDLVTKPRE